MRWTAPGRWRSSFVRLRPRRLPTLTRKGPILLRHGVSPVLGIPRRLAQMGSASGLHLLVAPRAGATQELGETLGRSWCVTAVAKSTRAATVAMLASAIFVGFRDTSLLCALRTLIPFFRLA